MVEQLKFDCFSMIIGMILAPLAICLGIILVGFIMEITIR